MFALPGKLFADFKTGVASLDRLLRWVQILSDNDVRVAFGYSRETSHDTTPMVVVSFKYIWSSERSHSDLNRDLLI